MFTISAIRFTADVAPLPCRKNPELFFSTDPADQTRAVSICKRCPLAAECLRAELAVPAADQHGTRGAMTQRQRRAVAKRIAAKGHRPSHSYTDYLPTSGKRPSGRSDTRSTSRRGGRGLAVAA